LTGRASDLRHALWQATFRGKSPCEAATAAIHAAHRAGAEREEGTQVLVQRLDPTYQIVWTYGRIHFP
jgi:hypothetical protein